jgi:hypothetical protein
MEQVIKTDEIIFKEELYPRTGINHIAVGNYAEKMRAGQKFPPIIIGKISNELILVDGYHRLLATKRIKENYIKADVRQYQSIKELFKDAVESNSQHGLQLTASDNVKILITLENMDFQPFEIAEILKATPERVERYQSRVLTGLNGKKIILKAPIAKLLEKGQITEEEAANVDQSRLTVQRIRDLMIQLLAVLQGDAYPWSDPDMRSFAVEVYQLLGRSVSINDV